MRRAEVSARGISVDGSAPTWGAFAQCRDPLAAAAEEVAASRNPRLSRLDRPTLAALVATHFVLGPRDAQPVAVVLDAQDGSPVADRAYWETARGRGGAGASPSLFVATLPSAVAGEIALTFGLRCAFVVFAGAGSAEALIAAAAGIGAAAGGGPRLEVRLSGWRGAADGVAVVTSLEHRIGSTRRTPHD